MSIPRRTCPACAARYAGLVADDCPICRGLGVLPLGAAALAHFPTAAVARTVELYLEAKAQDARDELPLGQHRATLEAAVDELRTAGVLHSTADAAGTPARQPTPPDDQAPTVTELNAYQAVRQLGATPTVRVIAALAAPPLTDLTTARPRGAPPTASATGLRSATATIADPIDPLGPDTTTITAEHAANDHRARVIAAAVPTAATRRQRKTRRR